jgi:hypothetical protein
VQENQTSKEILASIKIKKDEIFQLVALWHYQENN